MSPSFPEQATFMFFQVRQQLPTIHMSGESWHADAERFTNHRPALASKLAVGVKNEQEGFSKVFFGFFARFPLRVHARQFFDPRDIPLPPSFINRCKFSYGHNVFIISYCPALRNNTAMTRRNLLFVRIVSIITHVYSVHLQKGDSDEKCSVQPNDRASFTFHSRRSRENDWNEV